MFIATGISRAFRRRDVEDMSDEAKMCAIVSHAAYSKPYPSTLQTPCGVLRYETSLRSIVGNRACCYKNDDYAIFAFKGTTFTHAGDLFVDYSVLGDYIGAVGHSFGQIMHGNWPAKCLDAVQDRNQKLFLTGHSLGGTGCQRFSDWGILSSYRRDIHVHVFNAGVGLGNKALGGIEQVIVDTNDNWYFHHIFGDIISAGTFPGFQDICYKRKPTGPRVNYHSLEHFIPDHYLTQFSSENSRRRVRRSRTRRRR